MLNWFLNFGMLKIEVWGYGIGKLVFEMTTSPTLFLSILRNVLFQALILDQIKKAA